MHATQPTLHIQDLFSTFFWGGGGGGGGRVTLHAFLLAAHFLKNQLYQKILAGIPSEYETVWIQNRPNVLLGLIWVLTIFKGKDKG